MSAAVAIAKRWRGRAQRWVAPGDVFSPRNFAVDALDGRAERLARAFVVEHHYEGTYPASQLAVALFRGRAVAGVAVFSNPITQLVVPARTGFAAEQGVELGRLALAPEVAYNGETWFLARAFALLRQAKPELRAVVSYADPLERADAGGLVVKPQHWGIIYQASNATFVGRSSPRTQILAPSGRVLSGRALTKIRKQEQGCEYAARQLLAAGAPPRQFGEDPAAWVERALRAPGFLRRRHPGNLAYVFGLDAVARAAVRHHARGGLPYPKRLAA
ncbi:MAG: hypothetical protein ACJ8AO_07735 [Gemmatimonadaceae bacterium]